MVKSSKKSYGLWIVVAIVLILTLPLFYLLFVNVLLPMGWNE